MHKCPMCSLGSPVPVASQFIIANYLPMWTRESGQRWPLTPGGSSQGDMMKTQRRKDTKNEIRGGKCGCPALPDTLWPSGSHFRVLSPPSFPSALGTSGTCTAGAPAPLAPGPRRSWAGLAPLLPAAAAPREGDGGERGTWQSPNPRLRLLQP